MNDLVRSALRFQMIFVFVNSSQRNDNGKYSGVIFFVLSCIINRMISPFMKIKSIMISTHCGIRASHL